MLLYFDVCPSINTRFLFVLFALHGVLRQIRLLLHHLRLTAAVSGSVVQLTAGHCTHNKLMLLMFAQTFRNKICCFS